MTWQVPAVRAPPSLKWKATGIKLKQCIRKLWAHAVLEARFLLWPVVRQSLGVTTVIFCKSSSVLLMEKGTGLYTVDTGAPCSHTDPPNTTASPPSKQHTDESTCQWRHRSQIFTTRTNANNREITVQRTACTHWSVRKLPAKQEEVLTNWSDHLQEVES